MGQIEGLLQTSTTPTFPEYLKLRPEFESISVEQELLNDFLKTCKICEKYNLRINVQYDTTFNLCDYYLSLFSFVHPFLLNSKKQNVAIPLIYFFHVRKYTETNETFWNYFYEKVGANVKDIFIITDCEDAMSFY